MVCGRSRVREWHILLPPVRDGGSSKAGPGRWASRKPPLTALTSRPSPRCSQKRRSGPFSSMATLAGSAPHRAPRPPPPARTGAKPARLLGHIFSPLAHIYKPNILHEVTSRKRFPPSLRWPDGTARFADSFKRRRSTASLMSSCSRRPALRRGSFRLNLLNSAPETVTLTCLICKRSGVK